MKHTVLLALLALSLTATMAVAQPSQTRLGLRVGGNLAQLRGADGTFGNDATDRKLGLTVGAFAHLPLNDRFALQPELLFTQKGGTVSETIFNEDIEGTFESDFNLSYLELPVLASYSFPTRGRVVPSLFAGPYVGYSVERNVSFKLGGDDGEALILFDAGDLFKKVDYGAVFGVDFGYRKMRRPVTLGVRYNLGLTNVFKDDAMFSLDEEEVDLDNPRARAHEFSVVLGVKLF